jgi:hypothetical protein
MEYKARVHVEYMESGHVLGSRRGYQARASVLYVAIIHNQDDEHRKSQNNANHAALVNHSTSCHSAQPSLCVSREMSGLIHLEAL